MSLQATRAGLVASPAATGKSSQSLLRAWTEQTDLIYFVCDKVVICNSSSGILGNLMCFIISIGRDI